MNAHPQFEEDFDLYVMGALEDSERAAFIEHLQSCDDCAGKLGAARSRLALMTLAAPAEIPPASVRDRLLRQVRAERKAAKALDRPPRRPFVWLIPALAFACLFLLAALIHVQRRSKAMQAETANLKSELEERVREAERAKDVLAILTAPETERVVLSAAGVKPFPQGKAFYHPRRGLVFYAANMPGLPPSQTYELWLLPVQGDPVAAGTFNPDAKGNGSIVLPALPLGVAAKGFAVTVEQAGGVSKPTSKIIVVGLVS